MAVPYKSRALQPGQIRLLELLPTQHRLEAKIGHYQVGLPSGTPTENLDPVPPYHALSYHWDPRPKPDDELPVLIIKDKEGDYRLSLRHNLHAALVAIGRKALTHGWLSHIWVDAICIDQLVSHDQNVQLSMIGQVYAQADTVIVWIGRPDPVITMGMSYIKRIQDVQRLRDFVRGCEYAEHWRAFASLARQASFTRRWIVQEIVAAKNAVLLSGDESVSWEAFAEALSVSLLQSQTISAALLKAGTLEADQHLLRKIECSGANLLVETRAAVLRKRAHGDIAEYSQPMEALLTSLSLFEVVKPHDAVFALLWLSGDVQKEARPIQDLYHCKRRRIAPSNLTLKSEDRKEVHGSIQTVSRARDMFGHTLMVARGSNADGLQTAAQCTQSMPAKRKNGPQWDQARVSAGIRIDYQQSVFELCRQVLEHIIRTTRSLDILCFPWAPRPQKKNHASLPPRKHDEEPHPSWLLTAKYKTYTERTVLPDFDRKVLRRDYADPIVGIPGAKQRPYLACGRTRATKVKIEGRVLHATGYALAVITDTGETAYGSVIPISWRDKLGWTDASEPPPDPFWRTLVGDKGPDDQPPPSRFRLACKWAFEIGAPECDVDLKAIRETSEDGIDAPLIEYLDRAIATTWDRKLFLSNSNGDSSDSRLVGIGPSTVQAGDMVCVLLGCSVPVLLRPLQTRISALPTSVANSISEATSPQRQRTIPRLAKDCTFVGECFVFGQMNGECFGYADMHNVLRQKFRIH